MFLIYERGRDNIILNTIYFSVKLKKKDFSHIQHTLKNKLFIATNPSSAETLWLRTDTSFLAERRNNQRMICCM